MGRSARWRWRLIAALLVVLTAWVAFKVLRRPLERRVPTRAEVAAVFARVPTPTTPDEKRIDELLKELQDPKTSRERFFKASEETLRLEEKAHGHQGQPMDLAIHKMLAHAYTDEGRYREAIPHWEALLAAGPERPEDRFLLEWMLSSSWEALKDWPKARQHAEATLAIARSAGMSKENLVKFEQELDNIKAMERKPLNSPAVKSAK